MELITLNYRSSLVRQEVHQGQKHLVVPMAMIVEGVLPGSEGPLFYPMEEITRNYRDWERTPIVITHPKLNGKHVSVHKMPGSFHQSGVVGFVASPKVTRNKLVAEAWLNVDQLNKVAPTVLNRLERGERVEISTGLFTTNEEAPLNARYNNRPYTHIARQYRPDHLAILPDEVGACSIDDGCGLLVNESTEVDEYNWPLVLNEINDEDFELVTNLWSAKARAAAILARRKGRQLIRGAGNLAKRVTDAMDLKAARIAARLRKAVKGKRPQASAPTPPARKPVAPKRKATTSPPGKTSATKKAVAKKAPVKAPAKKAATKGPSLPTNPRKLKISDAAAALKSKGMTLGKGTTDLKTKVTSYEVTDRKGRKTTMTAQQIKESLYKKPTVNCGGKGGKPGPCKAGVNHPVGQVRLGMKRVGSSTFRHIITGHQVGPSANKPGHYYVRDDKGRPLGTTTSLDKAFKKASKRPTTNTSTEGDTNLTKPLTANARTRAIEFIIANSCGCFKPGDEEVLGAFPDDRLRELRLNAKQHQEGSQEDDDPTANCGGNMDGKKLIENMSDADLTAEMERRKAKNKPAPTANTQQPVAPEPAKPQTAEEWLKTAPAAIQEVVRNSMRREQEERDKLVTVIVNSAPEADRPGIKTLMETKPLDELKTLSLLLVNARPQAPAPQPMYFGGAGGQIVGNSQGNGGQPTVNREEVLVMPTINYAELAQAGRN
jgi:hypothetical protein